MGHFDFNAATGKDADVADMSALPTVLQTKVFIFRIYSTKNFGLRGRTKYTHLVDQDTSIGADKVLFTRDEVTAANVRLHMQITKKQAGMRDIYVVNKKK